MSARVTVVDEQTGESETVIVPDGDYLLITTDPAYLASAQTHANGARVLVVKGRTS